jgi:vancomycin permeability regulator SanA
MDTATAETRIVLVGIWGWIWLRKWWFIGTGIGLGILIIAPAIWVHLATRVDRYQSVASVPARTVAVVFGAGVLPDGTPTPYLERRLNTAVQLYKAGKAKILLLSGDNSTSHYNEPVAMKRYAVAHGVKEQDIVLDYAGFNTYDSCYRAKAIFGVHQATLVTHDYHLPRAIWTCDSLGVKSIGLAAQDAGKLGRDFSINYLIRELGSTDKAALQNVFKPKPTVLGKFEPITKM